jgi:hypothetical protein
MLGLFLERLRNWQLLKKGSAPWVSEWVSESDFQVVLQISSAESTITPYWGRNDYKHNQYLHFHVQVHVSNNVKALILVSNLWLVCNHIFITSTSILHTKLQNSMNQMNQIPPWGANSHSSNTKSEWAESVTKRKEEYAPTFNINPDVLVLSEWASQQNNNYNTR